MYTVVGWLCRPKDQLPIYWHGCFTVFTLFTLVVAVCFSSASHRRRLGRCCLGPLDFRRDLVEVLNENLDLWGNKQSDVQTVNTRRIKRRPGFSVHRGQSVEHWTCIPGVVDLRSTGVRAFSYLSQEGVALQANVTHSFTDCLNTVKRDQNPLFPKSPPRFLGGHVFH